MDGCDLKSVNQLQAPNASGSVAIVNARIRLEAGEDDGMESVFTPHLRRSVLAHQGFRRCGVPVVAGHEDAEVPGREAWIVTSGRGQSRYARRDEHSENSGQGAHHDHHLKCDDGIWDPRGSGFAAHNQWPVVGCPYGNPVPEARAKKTTNKCVSSYNGNRGFKNLFQLMPRCGHVNRKVAQPLFLELFESRHRCVEFGKCTSNAAHQSLSPGVSPS